MDVGDLIAKLLMEKQEIDQAISTLERLAAVRAPKRNGRKVRRFRPAPKNGKPPELPGPPPRTCRN